MRQDTGVDGDAQRISQLCWMFFLKIIDDQDQELEVLNADYRSPIPETLSVAHLGRQSRRHHGRHAHGVRQQRAVPRAEGAARIRRRRPPPRRPRRVRGCLQLHEVGSVDAAGGQQDQRDRLQQPRGEAAFRRDLRAGAQRPAERRQRGRVLHAARGDRVHGRAHRSASGRDSARPRVRNRRVPDVLDPPHAPALREDRRGRRDDAAGRCGRWRRSSCRTCCA